MRRLRLLPAGTKPCRKTKRMSLRLVNTSAKYLLTIPNAKTVAGILCNIALQHHPYDAQRVANALRTQYLAKPNDYPVQWMSLRKWKLKMTILANWGVPSVIQL